MDTAYRFARAYLDTVAGQLQRVVAVLGAQPEQVPIDNVHEAACAALRANALERTGQLPAAIAVLDHFNARAGAFQRHLLRRFIAQSGRLCPCEHSAPVAEQRQVERGKRTSEKAAGAPWLALAFAFFAALLAVLIGAPLALCVGLGIGHFAGGLCGLIAVPLMTLTIFEWRKARAARRVRATGEPVIARVVHARGTGQETHGVPQLLFRVLAMPSGGVPFYAHSMIHADDSMQQRLAPGAAVVVRLDPNERGSAQIELD